MANETLQLAAFASGLAPDAIPEPVRERAKALTLDLLGSGVRARAEAESTPAVMAALAQLGLDGPGACTVLGDARGYAPPVAALLNGVLGHSLDFDDTHAESSLHPSAPVVPAALAAGELVGAGGPAVLAAVVAGYEVCCRLGLALDPAAHYARGFHPTATAGVFGAAAAAGRVLGLDTDRMASAFGVAGSQASGSLQFLQNGAWNKRWQVGEAAMKGLIAASLAAQGFRGSAEPIEGKHGLLAGYTDDPHPDRVLAGLGEDWETLNIAVKPYPSCRYTHAALDALRELRRRHDLQGADVRALEVGLHRSGVVLVGEPEEAKRRPRNVVDGQFSMAFCAAVALDQGSFGWDDYRRLGEGAIDGLCDKVSVRRDEAVEAAAPHPFGARVRLQTAKGDFELMVRDPSGEPESFPDRAALEAKFLALAEPVLGDGARALADAILGFERFERISEALAAGRPAGGRRSAA